MSEIPPVVRNLAIIAALAAVIVVVPGGGRGADVVGQVLSLAFLGAIAWFAIIQYRQNRIALESLGERNRTVLYVALGVIVLTLTASNRLWATGGGLILWFALIAGAVFAVVSVVTAARR